MRVNGISLLLSTALLSVAAASAFHAGPSSLATGGSVSHGTSTTANTLTRLHHPLLSTRRHRCISGIRGGADAPPPSTSSSSLSMSPDPSVVFDNTPLFQSISIFALANGLGTILSLVGKTQVHVDLLGSGAFALAALPALLAKGAAASRVKLSAAAMALWSVKLASFLLFRILKMGEDTRLTDLFTSFSGTVGFWFFSLLWGVICSLPHTLGSTSSAPGNTTSTVIGTIVYAIGLIVETTADYQKWRFKSANPGKFCNVGLWSVSQHPNWLGNLLIWIGILVMNAPSLIAAPVPTGPGASDVTIFDTLWSYRRLVLACLSPAFMWFLFNGQAEGSLTSTVELAKGKYGNDPEYAEYVQTVSKIIPKVF